MTDLLEIGHAIRDAYASSVSEGHAAWMGYAGDGMRVYHVPELPGDGHPIDVSQLGGAADAESDALAKIDTRITVDTVRAIGDDMLALETTFTGTLPDGPAFRYPNVLLYTFRDGKIVQLVEVASADMWSTLRAALATVGFGAGRDSANAG